MTTRALFLFLTFTLVTSIPASAQSKVPEPVTPESLQWFDVPNNPSLRGAWVVGTGKDPGPYLLRVMLARNGRIPPHTHPDSRISTVLSGTLYVGFGEVMDESALVAVPEGSVYVAPANMAHYLMAIDGDVSYQESGFGPTAVLPIERE